MPKNSKVGKCVSHVEGKVGKVSAIKICQKATGQSYKTGKKAKSHRGRSRMKK